MRKRTQVVNDDVVARLKEYLINKGYREDSIQTEYKVDNYYIDLAIVENNQILEAYEVKTKSSAEITLKNKKLYERLTNQLSPYAMAFLTWIDDNNEIKIKKLGGPKDVLINSIESFNSFYILLNKHFNQDETSEFQYFFRGHANTSYTFKPGIYRSSSSIKGIEEEHIIFKEAVRKCPSDFPNSLSTFEKLVKMQHYELPTRLLDITTNPLVALYFCCCQDSDKDGEVLIFKIAKSDLKYFDSDRVSVVSNIARRPAEFKIPTYSTNEEFNNSTEIQYLLHEIKQEKPHFKDGIVPIDLESVFCVLPKLDNPRIVRQSGAFFLFGINKEKKEPASFENVPRRIIINSKGKKKILKELALLGIDKSTLFPEIDKILQEIKQR